MEMNVNLTLNWSFTMKYIYIYITYDIINLLINLYIYSHINRFIHYCIKIYIYYLVIVSKCLLLNNNIKKVTLSKLITYLIYIYKK